MSDIMTCERFEDLLADHMEGGVHGDERASFDAHATSCPACAELLADLREITARAAKLGPIEPPPSVWAGIESRIGAGVLPLATRPVVARVARPRRVIPLAYGIAASLAMMSATAGLTYLAMKGTGAEHAPATTVAEAGFEEPVTPHDAGTPSAAESTGIAQLASTAESLARPGGRAMAPVRGSRPAAGSVYDAEISRLREVLQSRRDQLDPKTVDAIERSMLVIDGAIAQARAALAADPASRFLNDQLNDVLGKKLQLLQTAAMLPSA